MSAQPPSLAKKCVAEFVGTFILVFLGCGVVHTAVLNGAQSGLWQAAVIWGGAVTLAVYAVGAISGAHINPAVTVASWVWGLFPRREVVPYIFSQVVGAFVAAATLFMLFNPYLKDREAEKGIVRGGPGSELTATCYGEYFPNPGPLSTAEGPYSAEEHARFNERVTEPTAFMAEVIGTMLLALVIFAVTDTRNAAAPTAGMAPTFIGLAVAVLVSVFAPLTQACLNPARDFGPRLFAYFAGWGSIALPGPRPTAFLTVYILAPILGGILGGGLYFRILKPPPVQAEKLA